MKGEFVQVNPIIDISPAQGGKVHDEVPCPWLASFGNNSEAANMKIWVGRSTKRTSHPTKGNLIDQILVNLRGMLSYRWLIFLCRLELLGGRKTQVKPTAESLQHKVDLLLVGMKSQLQGKLLSASNGVTAETRGSLT